MLAHLSHTAARVCARVVFFCAIAATFATGCTEPVDQAPGPPSRVQVKSEITWPNEAPDADALSLLSDEARAAINSSPVPVLVPYNQQLLPRASILADRAGYAFVAEQLLPESTTKVGYSIELSATYVGYEYPGSPNAATTVETSPTIVVQEDDGERILRATWSRYGVAYRAMLVCAGLQPCGDDVLEGILDSTVYVGGVQ